MDLVSRKFSILHNIAVGRFFCYKNLSVKNLLKNNNINIKENFAPMKFEAKFSFYKLHKYYSRLYLLKKNLLKNFFFFFLFLKNSLFFRKKQNMKLFFWKSLSSLINSILFPKIHTFVSFFFTVVLKKETLISRFFCAKSYFILFFFFIICFFVRLIKQSAMFTFKLFVDVFLLFFGNEKNKNSNLIKINSPVFFEKFFPYKQQDFLFFFNKKIFGSSFFISDFVLFL